LIVAPLTSQSEVPQSIVRILSIHQVVDDVDIVVFTANSGREVLDLRCSIAPESWTGFRELCLKILALLSDPWCSFAGMVSRAVIVRALKR
jgi:hypothetical protein